MAGKQSLAVLSSIVAAFFFGISTPLSKTLVTDLNPFLLSGLLYLGAGAGLLVLQITRAGPAALSADTLRSRHVLGMIFFGGITGPVFLMTAIKLASAASVSIWLNLELIATALLGHFFFKDRLGIRGWISIIIGLIAGISLSFEGGAGGLAACILTALACLSWGLDNHFTALIDNISPAQSTTIKGLAAGATNTMIGLAVAGTFPSPAAAAKALVVGFICYGLSITLYISSAQRLGAVRSQLIFSAAPVFGVALSVMLLGETLSAAQALSGALLFSSVWLMMAEKHAHSHEHQPLSHSHRHGHDDLHHDHHTGGAPAPHVHPHTHEKAVHDHSHWPDLHHRHTHE